MRGRRQRWSTIGSRFAVTLRDSPGGGGTRGRRRRCRRRRCRCRGRCSCRRCRQRRVRRRDNRFHHWLGPTRRQFDQCGNATDQNRNFLDDIPAGCVLTYVAPNKKSNFNNEKSLIKREVKQDSWSSSSNKSSVSGQSGSLGRVISLLPTRVGSITLDPALQSEAGLPRRYVIPLVVVGPGVVVGPAVVVGGAVVVVVAGAAVVVVAFGAAVVVTADSAACAGAMIDSTTGLVHRAGNSISVATPPTKIVIFLTTSRRVVS